MKRLFIILIMMLNVVGLIQAQGLHRVYFSPEETADVAKNSTDADRDVQQVHGSVGFGGGVLSGFGHTLGYGFAHAELSYRISDNFVMAGGFGRAIGFDDMAVHWSQPERSFAPRRRQASNVHLEGLYKVNDRLTVAAAVFYQEGTLLPLPGSLDAYALGISAAMRYRLGDNKYLGLYLQYVRSEGMPFFYGYDDLAGWGSGLSPMMGGPFACRHLLFDMADF